MFRRREDGTEELITDENTPTSGAGATTSASSSTSGVSPAAPGAVPATPTNPVPAAPAAQSFRPAPPQAAVAASRSAATLAPAAAAPATESVRTPATPAVASRPAAAKRVLTVGPDIQMKGEITSCDRVVIEGMVDATMRDVHTVELAETGTLKGTAEVEDAEISGNFEGDLTVRGKLTITTSGRVRGNVTYGEIEIQRGGQISGNVRNANDAKATAAPASNKKAA